MLLDGCLTSKRLLYSLYNIRKTPAVLGRGSRGKALKLFLPLIHIYMHIYVDMYICMYVYILQIEHLMITNHTEVFIKDVHNFAYSWNKCACLFLHEESNVG